MITTSTHRLVAFGVLVAAATWVCVGAPGGRLQAQVQPAAAVPVRMNRLIPLLQQGKPIFGNIVLAGAIPAAKQAAGAGWDFVGFDVLYSGPELETSLQYLIDRKQLLAQGSLAPAVVPLARVAPNGTYPTAWLTKQSLDQGVFGMIFPRVSTVEQARNALVYSRYAQKTGVPDFEPQGHRGVAPGNAQRWWGISNYVEYHRLADVWPQDPAGEILDWIVIEDEEGVRNLPEILRNVKISSVIGDEQNLALNLGLPGEPNAPEVQAALAKILATGKQFKVPVGVFATRDNIEKRVLDGFQILITGDPVAVAAGRKAAASKPSTSQ